VVPERDCICVCARVSCDPSMTSVDGVRVSVCVCVTCDPFITSMRASVCMYTGTGERAGVPEQDAGLLRPTSAHRCRPPDAAGACVRACVHVFVRARVGW
jgi:hypothetical protein